MGEQACAVQDAARLAAHQVGQEEERCLGRRGADQGDNRACGERVRGRCVSRGSHEWVRGTCGECERGGSHAWVPQLRRKQRG